MRYSSTEATRNNFLRALRGKQLTEAEQSFSKGPHHAVWKYRAILQQGIDLSDDDEQKYQELVEQMAEASLCSNIEKRSCSEWDVSQMRDYILRGNDLAMHTRDQYIAEKINTLIGKLKTYT